MDSLWHFAGNFWWLIFPLGGMIGGSVRAISAANERRAERRLERYRIKQQTKVAMAEAARKGEDNATLRRRELRKISSEHLGTDARWLEYEMDVAKLLDFPMMTDMRDPLTIAFHRAKSRADLLRPENPMDLLGDRAAQLEYRDAVHEYRAAFDVAESEAIRRRRSDFSAEDQSRIGRAQNLLRLASDTGATTQERQQAYTRARAELDGLIALPAPAIAALEHRIAGAIEA